jgi:uncharacterized cupin superfamily protein
MNKPERPAFIKYYLDLQEANTVKGGEEDLRAEIARFGLKLGLTRIGVNLESIAPGCRSSYPHAHEKNEEFVFVLEGTPDVWIDGYLHRLGPGDGVAFPAGTGIAHTLINNSDSTMRLLIVGERHLDDRGVRPLNRGTERRPWRDWPEHPLGPHDGKPDKPQQRK